MNDHEGAGFVHLYGLSSILNALQADERDFTTVHKKRMDAFEMTITQNLQSQGTEGIDGRPSYGIGERNEHFHRRSR